MVAAVLYAHAVSKRRIVESAGNGEKHWRSDYLGRRGQTSSEPEAFLIEMTPNETLLPHFHAVDQFQVFVEGSGVLGREMAAPLTVHYADHHTGYGPIVASTSGLSYFTFRPITDPGAVYLNKPGYREALKPSARRHATTSGLILETSPVLASRQEVGKECLLSGLDATDGTAASLIRMGAGLQMTCPVPSLTGGQYYLVVNGSIVCDAEDYPRWTILFVSPDEKALTLQAGRQGAEVLVLEFAKRE